MQFTATLVAAILAAGVSAIAIPNSEPVFEAQCMPIMDKGQTILKTDCADAVKQLRAMPADHACNRMLSNGPVDYLTVGSCRVQTDGNGSQQCASPAKVAKGLQNLIDACGNQWGFLDTARISISGDKFATSVSVAEVPSDGPVATPWDNQ